jgi:thiol-disulfide isomerase/thioredoxin
LEKALRLLIVSLAIFWGLLPLNTAFSVQPPDIIRTQQPAVKAILFRADWCVNCHILEPVLDKAFKQDKDLPVNLVVLDFTYMRSDPASWDAAVDKAIKENVVKVFNAYAGITGLVVLTAADTGEQIGCINRTFSAKAMVHAMQQAVQVTKTLPQGKRAQPSVFCPPARAPL